MAHSCSKFDLETPGYCRYIALEPTVGIMPSVMTPRCRLLISILVGTLWLMGCSGSTEPTPGLSPATSSATPSPPTPSPEPMAAFVNGEPIRLADFEDELSRFEASQVASGTDLATLGDYKSRILQALIDRRLLAQGARVLGAEVNDASINQELEQLATELGGNEVVGTWLAEKGYTLDGFKAALAEEMLAAQMVEWIIGEIAESAEQVHARHILVATQDEAEALHDQLIAGADFIELARLYSLDPSTRPAGGDLGWFPQGYLLIAEVEAVAFSLQPGDVSDVVKSNLGYHIVQTIDREEQPLSPDALLQVREQAVVNWLSTQRETVEVQILNVP